MLIEFYYVNIEFPILFGDTKTNFLEKAVNWELCKPGD